MPRSFRIALLFWLLVPVVCRAGEVIDRLVASVERQPILLSDWEEAVAFDALQQGRPVSALSSQERAAVLDRMIDQRLLLGQMGDVSVTGAPEEKRIQAEIDQIRGLYPGADTENGWQAVLARYGLRPQVVEEKIRLQLQVLGFIDLRLRPEAAVQRNDVEDYYKQKFVPEVRSRGGAEEALPAVYSRIEEVLRQQRIDELLTAWLHNLREQSNVQKFVSAPDKIASRGDGGC